MQISDLIGLFWMHLFPLLVELACKASTDWLSLNCTSMLKELIQKHREDKSVQTHQIVICIYVLPIKETPLGVTMRCCAGKQ